MQTVEDSKIDWQDPAMQGAPESIALLHFLRTLTPRFTALGHLTHSEETAIRALLESGGIQCIMRNKFTDDKGVYRDERWQVSGRFQKLMPHMVILKTKPIEFSYAEARLTCDGERWASILSQHETTQPIKARGAVLAFAYDNLGQPGHCIMLPPAAAAAAADKERPVRAPSSPEGDEAAHAQFQKQGQHWIVGFPEDKKPPAIVLDLKGMTYIHILLQSPGQKFSNIDLRLLADGTSDPAMRAKASALDAQSPLESTDREALKDYDEQIRELDASIEDPEEIECVKEECRQKKKELLAHVRSVGGLFGAARAENPEAVKARASVLKAINVARNAIRESHPRCATYLLNAIKTGHFAFYEPQNHVDWLTDPVL